MRDLDQSKSRSEMHNKPCIGQLSGMLTLDFSAGWPVEEISYSESELTATFMCDASHSPF